MGGDGGSVEERESRQPPKAERKWTKKLLII